MTTKKPEKKEETGEKGDRMAALLASDALGSLRKKYGKSIVSLASMTVIKEGPRIPSGIFPLDLALGGGWLAGRIHGIYGLKSSSKTTVALKTLAEAQRRCAVCCQVPLAGVCECPVPRVTIAAYIDSEGTLDMTWAVRQGIDPTRFLYSQPESAEAAINVCDELLRSGDVDVMVVDSIAFMATESELEKGADENTIGLQARKVGIGIRKMVSAQNALGNENGRRPTVFLINQIRLKVGVMFGNPETQPGGMAPGFAATTEIRMGSNSFKMDEQTGKPTYVDITFKIEKNKSAVAKGSGEYRLVLTDMETKKLGEVYDENVMIEEAEKCGLLEKKGSKWTILGEDFTAKSLIEKRARVEPEFKEKLRTALMRVLLPSLP